MYIYISCRAVPKVFAQVFECLNVFRAFCLVVWYVCSFIFLCKPCLHAKGIPFFVDTFLQNCTCGGTTIFDRRNGHIEICHWATSEILEDISVTMHFAIVCKKKHCSAISQYCIKLQ